MICEFDKRQAWAEMGSRSCAHWLNWRCGISVHTAREKIRVAHALADLEKVSRAFECGQLSYSKVRALTRVADQDTEDTFLNIALSGTAAQIERLVRCDARLKSEEELVFEYENANNTREFSWYEDHDGTVVFQGRLPAEQAARVISAIESAEQELAAEQQACEEALNKTTDKSPNGSHDKSPTATQRRADAFVHLAEQSCNGYHVMLHVPAETFRQHEDRQHEDCLCEAPQVPRQSPENCLEIAALRSQRRNGGFHTVPAETFASNSQTQSENIHTPTQKNAYLEKSGPISMEAARRICCDAGITPVVEGKYGEVLDIGRKTRKIPPAIRRALEVRDKNTCRFPGCTHTRYLHGHHIKHWSHGGVTALNNLVLLCSHHHTLVHEGGFSCRAIQSKKNGTVNIIFKRPDGVVLPDAFALRPPINTLENTQPGLQVDESTCTARDAGKTLDINWVLDALWFDRAKKE